MNSSNDEISQLLDRPIALFWTAEDYQYFSCLLNKEDNEKKLSPDDEKKRNIVNLILHVKNGSSLQRETALSQLTDKARDFGAESLLNCIFPLLMHPNLQNRERLELVKVIDRVLHNLGELVSSFARILLVLVGHMLIDEDNNARVLSRQVIYKLSKAVGLKTMIAALRPDIDNIYDDVRYTTAIAFGVVALALGLGNLLPFLKLVCQSKRSWQARHTGFKIVEQISALIENGQIFPSLTDVTDLVEIIKHGKNDDCEKIKCIALSLSARDLSS